MFLHVIISRCLRVWSVIARRRDSVVFQPARPAAVRASPTRWSGNVAGGIDSAPQPQPHVCRAAMIPKPCWPSNGFSAVTRKPLLTTRRDEHWANTAGQLRVFRYRSRAILRIFINRNHRFDKRVVLDDG